MSKIQEVEVIVKLYVEIKDPKTPWFAPGLAIKQVESNIGEAVEKAIHSNADVTNPENGRREAWKLLGTNVHVQD